MKKLISLLVISILSFVSFFSFVSADNQKNIYSLNNFEKKELNKVALEIKNLRKKWMSFEEIDKILLNRNMERSYNPSYIFWRLLSDEEKKLYDWNIAKWTLCIASWAIATTYTTALLFGNNSIHNWNWDAYRHILWNYIMARDVWYDFAKKWSDAHENYPGNPEIEKTMDLHNNSIWLSMGKDAPWYNTNIQASIDTWNAVKDWKWYRIYNWELYLTNSNKNL